MARTPREGGRHELLREHHEGARRPRLLVLDDNQTNRDLLVDVLTNTGYSVDEAEDGGQALKKLRGWTARYDLVLLDMQMPKMDGFQVAREIRADAGRAAPGVVMRRRNPSDL